MGLIYNREGERSRQTFPDLGWQQLGRAATTSPGRAETYKFMAA